jgi:hypothetical protein
MSRSRATILRADPKVEICYHRDAAPIRAPSAFMAMRRAIKKCRNKPTSRQRREVALRLCEGPRIAGCRVSNRKNKPTLYRDLLRFYGSRRRSTAGREARPALIYRLRRMKKEVNCAIHPPSEREGTDQRIAETNPLRASREVVRSAARRTEWHDVEHRKCKNKPTDGNPAVARVTIARDEKS